MEIPDYELVHRIGQGSYGEVWLARNVMGALRAVKIVRRSSFSDDRPYEREYRGLQKFEPVSRSHEGLINILHIGSGDGFFYYVMELADSSNAEGGIRSAELSEADKSTPHFTLRIPPSKIPHSELETPHSNYSPMTLRSEIARRGRFSVTESVETGLTLARALQHLHGSGLVHRDIKPSNIIFVNGKPKLADIGLVVEHSDSRTFVGTEGYIPPEGPGTPQADVFALGVVLYEMTSGKDCRDFPDPVTQLDTAQDSEPLREINAVIHTACETGLQARYPTAAKMVEDLERLSGGRSVKRHRAARSRRTWALKLGIPAVILVCLFFAIRHFQNRPMSPIRARWRWWKKRINVI